MKAKGLLLAAAAAQFALVASVPQPNAQASQASGKGFWDAVECAGCIATGILMVTSGTAEVAAVAVVAGGEAAIAAATAVTACVHACAEALT
jgi:hypothetical protein